MVRIRPNSILHGLSIVVVMVCMVRSAEAQTRLQWSFEKDQQRQSEIVQKITQVVNDQSLVASTAIYVTSTVDDVAEDGSATMTKTINRVSMSITMPDGTTLAYDTSTSETPKGTLGEFSKVLKSLVGWQVRMTVATNGRVSDAQTLTGANSVQSSSTLFSSMLKSGHLEQLFSKTSFVFPDEELADGTEWKVSGKSSLPVGQAILSAETTYRYRGQHEENGQLLDRFDVQTTVAMTSPSTVEPPANADSKGFTVLDQRSTGELLFDAHSSVVVRSRVEQVLTLVYSVAGQEVKQNLTIETSQTSSLVDLTPVQATSVDAVPTETAVLIETAAQIEDQAATEPTDE